MPFSRTMTVLLMICFLGACDVQVPQEIYIDMGDSIVGAEVSVFPGASCDGEALQGAGGTEGSWRFETDSTRGGVGVVTQQLTVCLKGGEASRIIWTSLHGGGARRINLICDQYAVPACKESFTY